MTNDPVVLIQQADGTNTDVYTFPLSAGTITPTAGRVVIVAFFCSATSLRTVDSVSTTIGDLTLTHVRSRTFRTGGTPTARIDVYRGLVGASPTAGTVSVDYSGACSYGFCIVAELPAETDVSGTNGSGAIGDQDDNFADNTTGVTVTMNGFGAAANALLGIFAADDNIALTPGDSDEEHAEVQHTDNGVFQLTWRNVHGSDLTIATSGSTSEDFGGIALEIVAATGGGDTPIDAQPGSYSTTGQTASTLYGRVNNAESGAYSLSGQSATTAHGRLLSADPGSYSISGAEATTTHASPNVVMVADPGSYDLTGVATTHLIGTVGQAEAGTYSVTGQLASTLYGRVGQAEPGTYGITGFEATTLHGTPNVAITADPGSYAVAGSAIESLVGRVMAADAGSYALTGAEATTLYGRVLSADAGAYAFAGMSVTTAYSGDRPSAELFGLLHTQPKLSGSTHTQSRLMGDPRTGPRYSGEPH